MESSLPLRNVAPVAGMTAAMAAPEADARSLGRGLGILAIYATLYVATLVGAIADLPIAVNLLFAIANGVAIALLFIIGHDGCHGSFVPGREWNAWIARLAFIPCVHSPSLWRVTHNEQHHRATNLKGVDRVWAPMSKEEYDKAAPARRWLERAYRGPLGPLIYYYGEFWAYRLVLPIAPDLRVKWKSHIPDGLFVLSGFALTLAAIVLLGTAFAPHRPGWLVLTLGWAAPFAVWNYVMGLTIYVNHTHPTIPWFRDRETWSFHRGNILSTAHVRLPANVVPLYESAMAHTAHHADTSVPVYALAQAQAELKERIGVTLCDYVLSFSEYRKIYTACKLFDFDRMCWTDFVGRPTASTWASPIEHDTSV